MMETGNKKKKDYDHTKDYELLRVLDAGLPNVGTVVVIREYEKGEYQEFNENKDL